MVRTLLTLCCLLLCACTSQGQAAPEAIAPSAGASPTAPPGPGCDPAPGCYGEAERTGVFDVAQVAEASGIAASVRNPGLLYLLNDGPESTGVWVARPDGTLLGLLSLSGLDPRDTEDVAVAPCGPGDPNTCIWIGDLGDNIGGRETVRVHRAVEPDLAAGVPAEPVGADSVLLRYPDGVANAETLLVDDAGTIHIVTKGDFDEDTGVTGPTRLYRAAAYADGDLVPLGELAVPQPAVPLYAGFVGNVVTGGDVAPGRVLLRTYDAVHVWTAPDPAAALETFPTWPVAEVPSAAQRQSEAVAWTATGCGYWSIGEGSGDIWFVGCR